MTNEELKKKIAQIIADYFCPQGNEHKKLWGDDRLCYSKMNFAECEWVTECTDALIAAGIRFGENFTATFDRMALEREHELERRLAEATKAMYVYERALYYATLNGETADEVKYNDALKRAQKDLLKTKEINHERTRGGGERWKT